MSLLLIAALAGLIPAAIAHSKGHSFFAWWLYGALLLIVALPHAILLHSDRIELDARAMREGMRKCPHCAELIRREAKLCRYCGRTV